MYFKVYIKLRDYFTHTGLTCLVSELQLTEWELKPFPPGHLAEYNILPDGKLEIVSLNRFFKIEEPILPAVPLEEGIICI